MVGTKLQGTTMNLGTFVGQYEIFRKKSAKVHVFKVKYVSRKIYIRLKSSFKVCFFRYFFRLLNNVLKRFKYFVFVSLKRGE